MISVKKYVSDISDGTEGERSRRRDGEGEGYRGVDIEGEKGMKKGREREGGGGRENTAIL